MKYTVSLRENRDFRRMYAKSDNKAGRAVVVYGRTLRRESNRVGITVSTKVGNAVTRNRARRRIKECYRLNEDKFRCGCDIVFVARTRAGTVPFEELEREMLQICRKLKLLRE